MNQDPDFGKLPLIERPHSPVAHTSTKEKSWKSTARKLLANRGVVWSMSVILLLSLLALIGPWVCSRSYDTTNPSCSNLAPSLQFWFGTDTLGRDMFARVWQGVRVSLLIGILGAIIPQVIGCLIGCISGYFGGRIDSTIMSAIDVGACIPTLVYITLITLLLGNSVGTLVLAISLSSWMGAARNCRSRMLQYRTREFVLAAHTQGLPPFHIIRKHILPNIAGQLVVNIFTAIPSAVFSEAYLSFIGLGIASPMTSLGQLCKSGVSLYRVYPYQFWIPGALLSLVIMAFYVLGNSLRDILDPRERTV